MWNEIQFWAGLVGCTAAVTLFWKWIFVGVRVTVVINEDGTEREAA